MKNLLRRAFAYVVHLVGSTIIDQRTGENVGKAIIFSFGGIVKIWGLHWPFLTTEFQPSRKINYGRATLGFRTHPEVDFSRNISARPLSPQDRVLWVILAHSNPFSLHEVLVYWKDRGVDPNDILIAYGGTVENFENLKVPNKVFVQDEQLRTKRHAEEKQSYSAVFREVSSWMNGRNLKAVFFFEEDHLPLTDGLEKELLNRLIRDDADALLPHLCRVDRTNSPHYVYHLSDVRFRNYWHSRSTREDRSMYFNAIITGSAWKAECIDCIAANPEEIPMYLELYLPSLIHHLGFRIRSFPVHESSISVTPISISQALSFADSGALSVHPIKFAPSIFAEALKKR